VVDDDISVRESLELLIKFAGWQPERDLCNSMSDGSLRPCEAQ